MEAGPKYYYARWLSENGRLGQAADLLRVAIAQNPSYIDSYYLLMQVDSQNGDADGVRAVARQTLARFPSDTMAQSWLTRASAMHPTPETYLNQSLA